MATAQATLTPAANTTPAVVSIPATELSGRQWVARFPPSESVADCSQPFRSNLERFLAVLAAAGAHVAIASTLRPPQRAYLMHWSWRIATGRANSQTIPSIAGVNIRWDHTDASGVYSAAASRSAAQTMVNGYGTGHLVNTAPALNTKHIAGLAVDMSITWTGNLTITRANDTATTITTLPREGMNTELHAVGATYGVIKYVGGTNDRPHWSDDGH
jgi:hypothetical protein